MWWTPLGDEASIRHRGSAPEPEAEARGTTVYHYELYRETRDELLRQAEHERLVRQVRKAARRARRDNREGPVIERRTAETFRKAA